MSERQGIEIDYCPSCRGVWLDRGELDKIVERSTQGGTIAGPSNPQQQTGRPQKMDDSDYGSHQYKKRKGSWFSELFD
jgi:Zn-finger nucleic acid-binding protein